MHLSVNIAQALSFLPEGALASVQSELASAHEKLLTGNAPGSDFLGWVRLPSRTTSSFLDQINATAEKIRNLAEVIVVIGIGGSYLGARAVTEALGTSFPSLTPSPEHPLILYAGENLSEDYHADLLDLLDHKEYAVVVISKSGTTTESAVAFRLLRNHLEKKYGHNGATQRIIAITDAAKGALRHLAVKEGYDSFIIPDDIGGRYSVLTPVGLLPIALAGFDIAALIAGARAMEQVATASPDVGKNPAALYAAVRNLLYRHGKTTEIMVTWQPHLIMLTEWWKQLFGESEGKAGKGIFPAGVTFSTDLHSMGQYIQDGPRNLFETVLSIQQPRRELRIPEDPQDTDGLNFLAGKRISEVNREAEAGTRMAHLDGGVPNLSLWLPNLSEEGLGELLYFFEYACGLSGYMLGVNPFDQPGVEAYKRNMFRLLGKPG